MRQEVLTRGSSPRVHIVSPSNSASPSPSPSEYSREPTPQYHRPPDRSAYITNPGTVDSERLWGSDPSVGVQHPPLYLHGYGSAPPFMTHYVDDGIAPHEQVPYTTEGRTSSLPSTSRTPTRSHTMPEARSFAAAQPPERCASFVSARTPQY